MRIYVCTDLEGASGVYHFAQTRERGTPEALQAAEYLMGDIAAVVRGLREGGASEIIVRDGHGGGANFLPHLMAPGARYIVGRALPYWMYGLDRSFDGLVLLGFHAMCGTEDGVLNHTQSSKAECRYWYNGVESGELAQCGAVAGHLGVPPILVTGDEATCREARRFFGPACVTVAVKKGIHREAAVLYPFEETRQALYESAVRAIHNLPRCKPYRLKMPVKAKQQRLEVKGMPGETKVVTRTAVLRDIMKIAWLP
jgi:D-amino peptidase